MSPETTVTREPKALGIFEKYLTLWVALCIVAGIVMGKAAPGVAIYLDGLANVEFRLGEIEHLPVADDSADVVISNCVINLSPDKPQVFREAFRVLKPGGKMVVSDIVLNRPLPAAARNDADLYAACIAGALLRADYLQAIGDAGFAKVEILSDNTYQASNACDDPITSGVSDALVGVAASITVLARRSPQPSRPRCILPAEATM